MFVKSSFTGILLATLFILPTLAAVPSQNNTVKIQTTKPIYSWHTESEKDPKSGQFLHCQIKNMYDNGTLMIMAENDNGEKRMALNFPQEKMQMNQQFDLTIQIDRRDVFPVEAMAINPTTLAIGIPDALPEQMRKGQMLHLRGPNDEVVYDLNGINGAVMSLHDCIIAQKNGTASSVAVASADTENMLPPIAKKSEHVEAPVVQKEEPKPVKEVPAPVPTPVPVPAVAAPVSKPAPVIAQNPIPDKVLPAKATSPVEKLSDKIETLQDNKTIEVASDPAFPQPWQNVFAGTAYSPDHLIPMKNKKPDQPLDYIWKNNDVFIGVKGKEIAKDETVGNLANGYMKMLKTRCAGNFVAQASPAQQSNVSWQIAEAACSNSSNGDSIAAMIFAVTPQGGQIYFFEAKAAQGASAIKARDAVLKKVAQ